MCYMTDVLYVYCDDHYGRQIISPCPSAMNHPGLATTGCWNAVTTNHTRVLDFCPVCKRARKDNEEYRQDKDKQFCQLDHIAEGPKTAIPEVTVRPLKERGQGQDSKIWLKSFGGSSVNASAANSANASRRGSVDPDARRDSHASIMSTTSTTSTQSTNSSTKSILGIISKSRYCKEPTSAAWGMTPEELHERSTTYLMENGKRSGSGASRPSRFSNLDTVKEQSQEHLSVPETHRGRPMLKNVDFYATRESRSTNEELSPLSKTPRVNFASLSAPAIDIGLATHDFGRYQGAAQKKTQHELFERQYAIAKKYEEEENRLLLHPDRPSVVQAIAGMEKKFKHMKTKPDVLEHMARHLERQRLESDEAETSSIGSSASGRTEMKIERRLSIPPDVRQHIKKLAEKLRRECDEQLELEVRELDLSLRCGERVDDVDDEIMAAVEEARRAMRKDRRESALSLRGSSLCKGDLQEINDMISAGLALKDIRKRLRQKSQDSAIGIEFDELE